MRDARGSRLEAKFQINLSLLIAAGLPPCERYLLVGSTLYDEILQGSIVLDDVDERAMIIFAGTNLGHLCHCWSELLVKKDLVIVLTLLQLWRVMRPRHNITIWRIGLGLYSLALPG